jgi:hypothetical protein
MRVFTTRFFRVGIGIVGPAARYAAQGGVVTRQKFRKVSVQSRYYVKRHHESTFENVCLG